MIRVYDTFALEWAHPKFSDVESICFDFILILGVDLVNSIFYKNILCEANHVEMGLERLCFGPFIICC